MTDLKKKLKGHLCSARHWLGKAEESLEKDRDIRAELNLMLAQAEITHAKEVKSESKDRRINYRGLLIRSILLIGLISFGIVSGFGGFIGTQQKLSNESQEIVPNYRSTLSEEVPLNGQVVPKIQETSSFDSGGPDLAGQHNEIESAKKMPMKQTVVVEETIPKAEAKVSVSEQPVRLQPREMQELISAAGKSLRGE
ncbi:hypothetical protein [Anaerosinus gibii]|uniref:Uncharacterized protein n=1 Tax=Selenobaculum gibii TaxID=3054208 RepID=A0A9Y2ERC5_9FIRM|nr:hypothetical protein [Selenobaculum gbiensis]WIW71027.1 hypothetical protein P3F81_01500 [Selenobaculum gbiensis]